LALFLDPLGDLFAFFTGDGGDGLASDPHGFRFLRHGRSPTPLRATPLGRFFHAFFLSFPALLILGHRRMWEKAKARRQTLVLALFFSPFNVDTNIVWVAPFLLELATVLPEAALVEALAVSKVFGDDSVHLTTDPFDLYYGALQRLLVGKRELPHAVQECDDMIHTLIQQEQALVDT